MQDNAIMLKGDQVDLEEATGEIKAVFATLDVIDRDGDVLLPKSIGTQRVRLSAYGHQSWAGAMPIGKGEVVEQGNEAIFAGRVFLDMPHAKEQFDLVRNMGDLQEWSFSLQDVVAENAQRDGKSVRMIKSVRVHEVSPVFAGAGLDTRLLHAKQGLDDCRCKELRDENQALKTMIEGMRTEEARRLVRAFSHTKGESLARYLEQQMGDDRSEAVMRMAQEAGISENTVNQILRGEIECPPRDRLQGFAEALGVSVSSVISAAEQDGCSYDE